MPKKSIPIPKPVARDVQSALDLFRQSFGDDYDILGIEVLRDKTSSGKEIWLMRIEVVDGEE